MNPYLSDKAKEDFKLVVKARDGDQKAYADLLGRYRDALYFMLLKMVNNKSDAEDLMIEAFGKAFKNIKQYTPNFAFSTWLFKIATNNCIDFLRKRKGATVAVDVGEQSSADAHGITLRSDGMDPEEKFIHLQKSDLMKTVIQKLKPRYRRLIELRYFKDYSYEEIAYEMDLPIGTVKAQLYRARELLYNTLRKTQED